MLVMVEMAAVLSPRNRAKITSGTVDMLTASAPMPQTRRLHACARTDQIGKPVSVL